MPCGINLRINVDHHIPLLLDLQMSCLNLIHDPDAELVFDQCIRHIDDPLLRKPIEVLHVRHVKLELLIGADLVEYVLD